MKHTQHVRVAVVILGYNHQSTLKQCLDSVLSQTQTPDLLRYIDNASTDTSVDFVRTHFPTVDICVNTVNNGYAGAYRTSLADLFTQDFDAVILLNPDTIVDSQWLKKLVDGAFQDDSVAIAQPKIYLYDTSTQTKTTRINTIGNCVHFLGFGYCGQYNKPDEPPVTTNQYITAASGASMLIKKTAYQKMLGLDESFFAYLEDQDMNWQAHLQGYKILLIANSLMWHQYDFHKKNLNNLKFYLLERNRLTFLLKNFEIKTLLLITPAWCVMECGMLFDALMRGYFLAKIKSYWDFIRTIPETLYKRRILQTTRTVSDKQLFSLLVPTIEFEAVDSPLLSLANQFLSWYYKCIRSII